MESQEKKLPKCKYCGRFFKPDPRVRNRQKSCRRRECRSKRKKESQAKWVAANPDCFKGRYAYLKEWRESHPGYQKEVRARKRREIQDERPPSRPVRTVRIVVPEKWLRGEIQDEILVAVRCGCGFYVGGERREIQDTIAHPGPSP